MRLILYRGNERLAVELRDGVYTIGRDERADIVIPNTTVSGRHAEIRVDGDTCTIRDLGSSNGTTVNGVRARGAQQIGPRDVVQVGSAQLGIEAAADAEAQGANDTSEFRASAFEVVGRASAAAEKVKRSMPWTLRFWFAGATAILVLALLMFLVEVYSQEEGNRTRRTGRYMAFASQYAHVLRERPNGPVPAPLIDDWFKEPRYVLDANGRFLHPQALPGEADRPSPLRDPKTGAIPERAKNGLYRLSLSVRGAPPIRVYSYPIRAGGDLLGYVIAQPGEGISDLPLISMMQLCTAAIALLALYFAMRPVVGEIREHIELLRGKLSPYAHGFIDALPRTPRVPELNDLADECESVLRSMSRDQPAAAAPSGTRGQQYGPFLPPLLEAASLPYCFITNDFHLLSASVDLASFAEFANARADVSIFEAGIGRVQSKQLIGAINDARNGAEGRAATTLTRRGETRQYLVVVRRFQDATTGNRGYGLLFAVQPSQL